MAVLGITGGIACGKSTVRDLLAASIGAAVFDADAAARHQLATNPAVHTALRDAWGNEVFSCQGIPDRQRIRDRIFSDPEAKAFLEGLLHPLVRAEWMALAIEARHQGTRLLIDIPLLFETGADTHLPVVVTVAASPGIQHERLAHRGLEPALGQAIISSQHPLEEKIRRSRWVIWNDGSRQALADQVRLLAEDFLQLPPQT